MKKRILYATSNPAKTAHMQFLLRGLGLEIVNLADTGIHVQIVEDGATPAENARRKVDFAFKETGLPVFAVDSGLSIERFTASNQPGLFVRRIHAGKEATDKEMLEYYRTELEKVGGQSRGVWTTAIALRIAADCAYSDTFMSSTLLTSKVSGVITAGEPLNSLQIDPATGRYYSEMTPDDRIKAQGTRSAGIVQFMKKYVHQIQQPKAYCKSSSRK